MIVYEDRDCLGQGGRYRDDGRYFSRPRLCHSFAVFLVREKDDHDVIVFCKIRARICDDLFFYFMKSF